MIETKSSICDFGWPAPDFALKGVDGKTYTLADVRGPNGTLVVFSCNHCPYVKASIGRIVATKRRRWREPITLSADPTFSASTRKMSYSIADGSMLRGYNRWQTPVATFSRP